MELILCRHTVTKRECEFPREAVPAWRGVGWLPVDQWPADPSAERDEAATPADPETTTTTKPAGRRGTKSEE
jgi:hypothetical protein